MKGLIMNDLFSLRKLLRSVAMVFVFFMVLWGAMGQPASGALMIGVLSVSYMLNLFSYDGTSTPPSCRSAAGSWCWQDMQASPSPRW